MYSSPADYTSSVKVAALGLGFLEDFVCTTYFVCVLSYFDRLKHKIVKRFEIEFCGKIATFVVSWLLFVGMMIPFVADLLLVVNRDMSFTFDLVTMAINEREFASAAPISAEEIHRGYVGGTVLTTLATVFAIVRTRTDWSDLSTWNPTHTLEPIGVDWWEGASIWEVLVNRLLADRSFTSL
ncbi:hypothetical protein DVH05_011175 [Phytophthora capsici]|nr:hypothetical protein DVH05_011175 [Phytophthora capsici]